MTLGLGLQRHHQINNYNKYTVILDLVVQIVSPACQNYFSVILFTQMTVELVIWNLIFQGRSQCAEQKGKGSYVNRWGYA